MGSSPARPTPARPHGGRGSKTRGMPPHSSPNDRARARSGAAAGAAVRCGRRSRPWRWAPCWRRAGPTGRVRHTSKGATTTTASPRRRRRPPRPARRRSRRGSPTAGASPARRSTAPTPPSPMPRRRRGPRPRSTGPVYGEPLVYKGQVFVATENDTVYALVGGRPARWRGRTAPGRARCRRHAPVRRHHPDGGDHLHHGHRPVLRHPVRLRPRCCRDRR